VSINPALRFWSRRTLNLKGAHILFAAFSPRSPSLRNFFLLLYPFVPNSGTGQSSPVQLSTHCTHCTHAVALTHAHTTDTTVQHRAALRSWSYPLPHHLFSSAARRVVLNLFRPTPTAPQPPPPLFSLSSCSPVCLFAIQDITEHASPRLTRDRTAQPSSARAHRIAPSPVH
jgi:hypothetical protein